MSHQWEVQAGEAKAVVVVTVIRLVPVTVRHAAVPGVVVPRTTADGFDFAHERIRKGPQFSNFFRAASRQNQKSKTE